MSQTRIDFASSLAAWIMLGLACLPLGAVAGEVTLKNGTVIEGSVTLIPSIQTGPSKRSSFAIDYRPVLLVTNDLQRYYVPARQLANNNKDADFSRLEAFTLPQKSLGRHQSIQSVGPYQTTPFDAFGRRIVSLNIGGGKTFGAIQGVTRITPQYLKVTGLNCEWNTGITTSSVPLDILDGMLRNVAKPNNPDHRLAIARFYLQAGMYGQAQLELASIRQDFKELADTVDEVSASLAQLQAQQFLSELRRMQAAGQHRRAFEYVRALEAELARSASATLQGDETERAGRFPVESISPAVLREIRELVAQYDQQREQAELAVLLMGELQAALTTSSQVAEVAPLRSEIRERLNVETVERLAPFLKLAQAGNLAPADKLALALSGWVLGSANAITDLDLSIRLWKARSLILAYLRTPGQSDRRSLLVSLQSIEGVDHQRITQLLLWLPPIIETDASPGVATTIETNAAEGRAPVKYTILLPPEYNSDHIYPLIIALHGQGSSPERELEFWGGTAERPSLSQRHGYVVIAPDYGAENAASYDYGPAAHLAVINSLHDACLRFSIDVDRVFLTGHALGGDAAFDVGLAHPDLFAGVIPMGGIGEKFCRIYWENAQDLPLYVIGGELDRDARDRNTPLLMDMMTHGYDVIFSEFKGYGQDSFFAEVPKVFLWMGRQKRTKFPRQITAHTRRVTDNRFWWLEVNELPPAVTNVDWTSDQRKPIRPITAKVTDGNTLHISSGARSNTVWLSPDFVDFSKRLAVRVNGVPKWNDFVRPDLENMLEDLRRRGDRQKLYWAVLEF